MSTLFAGVRLALLAAGTTLLGIGVWTARTRSAPSLRPFVVLAGVVGAFAVADGLAAGNPTSLSVVWLLAYLTIPTVFAWFVVEYYGLPHLATRRRLAALATLPAVAFAGGLVLIVAPSATGAMGGGASVGGLSVPAWLVSAASVAEEVGLYFAGGSMLAGVALLVQTTTTYDHLDRSLAVVLSFVPVWPWLAYLLTPTFVGAVPSTWLLAGTAAGYLLSAGAAVFAVTRGGLFDAAPAAGTLGPESVLSNLDEVVLVVDRDGGVVRSNDAAGSRFGWDTLETGRSLESVLGVGLAEIRTADSLDLSTVDGTRTFEATVTEIQDRHGRSPGYAVVLADVTRQRIRAQRLAVLNRVLRHNLRNEVTSIIARAELLADDGDAPGGEAERILAAADGLVDLGDRAREIERMMSYGGRDEADLADVVSTVLERHRDAYPDARLDADVDDSLRVGVDPRVLEPVLDNLVENGVVHDDEPPARVTVSARRTAPGEVAVSVADEGPGLPEHERAVLEAGEETQLQHASGLGLWAVAWGATMMGADLTFDDAQPRGTVATLRLPADESAATAVGQPAPRSQAD